MTEPNYSLETQSTEKKLVLPDYDYHPQLPKAYRPKIGIIGCGGITVHHLTAYKNAGLEVVALCDLNREAAEARRTEFYPEAEVFADPAALLARADIEVVDAALHVEPRAAVIEAALEAGKHVLSQKPFVLDIAEGRRLADLANAKGLKLAVNQNGRWAPYVRWILLALRDGLIGDVQSVNIGINWDHTWVKGTAFESMRHLILYDFAVHWLDMTRVFFGEQKLEKIFATDAFAPNQEIGVPMMASVLARFERGGAVLDFDGHSQYAAEERFSIRGADGTLRACGGVCSAHHIEVETEGGAASLDVEGSWFPDGFAGTMGELLCAIEEDREPENNAADNLKSLELVFAAMVAAGEDEAVQSGAAS